MPPGSDKWPAFFWSDIHKNTSYALDACAYFTFGGMVRTLGESDESLRARCLSLIKGPMSDSFDPPKPKVLKYPETCPCGMVTVACDYHKEVYA